MMPRSDDASSQRTLHYAAFVLLCGLVVSPALAREPRDDYPLSTYPMFSSNKDRITRVDHAVTVGPSDERILGPRFLGTDEVLQARATLSRAVRAGPAATKTLCDAIAARVAASPEYQQAERVEIRTVTFDAIAYFVDDDHSPRNKTLRASCPIPR